MSGYKLEAVKGSPKCALGEGPHWETKKEELIYVDLIGNAVLRYVPKTGKTTKVDLDDHVSAVLPVEGKPNKYLIPSQRSVHVLEWDGESAQPTSVKQLYDVEGNNNQHKVNDAKCDALGRLWLGSLGNRPSADAEIPQKKGSMYSFDLNGKMTKHFDKIDISNGLGWTSDNKTFYYVDSMSYKLDVFDFDLAAGTLSNRRTAYDFKANNVQGMPDGLTVDVNGNVWVAFFQGNKVAHIDPKVGKKIGQIDFPTTVVTSVAFGGPNLDILYATTGTSFVQPEVLANEPLAGSLFQVTNVGTKGLAPFNYKGPI